MYTLMMPFTVYPTTPTRIVNGSKCILLKVLGIEDPGLWRICPKKIPSFATRRKTARIEGPGLRRTYPGKCRELLKRMGMPRKNIDIYYVRKDNKTRIV